MLYKMTYLSPLGEMLLSCDGEGLTGAWFVGQKYFAAGLDENAIESEHEHLLSAVRWLDSYFSGKNPDFLPKIHAPASAFRTAVWEELLKIPYGETRTYGEISALVARRMGKEKMSAQAVGGAVGHNRISVIIPCHRVLGADGSLTGYAGGLDKKLALLRLEGLKLPDLTDKKN